MLAGFSTFLSAAMRIFVKSPQIQSLYEDMGDQLQSCYSATLKDRSNRAESRPVKKLLGAREEDDERPADLKDNISKV